MTTGPTTAAAVPRRAWTAPVMGMTASVHVRGPDLDGPRVTGAVEAAFAALRRADHVFSTYRQDSTLLRDRAGSRPCAADSADLDEVFSLCAEAMTRTQGFFDPAVRTPSGVVLDPTGLVKGWAVQRASGVLAELGEHDHYVAVAGDLSLAVHREDTAPWQVGISSPFDRDTLVTTTKVGTGAVATSGTGERGGHVRDPFTGRFATELASVTVLGPELVWADVYATAALARGLDALRWLPTLAEHEWFVVAADGCRWRSPGWTGPTGAARTPRTTSSQPITAPCSAAAR